MPGAHLGAGDTSVNKPDKASTLMEAHSSRAQVPDLIRDSHRALRAGGNHHLFFSLFLVPVSNEFEFD